MAAGCARKRAPNTVPADRLGGVENDERHTAPGELALRVFGPLADALGVELAKLPPFATRNLTLLAERFAKKDARGDVRELSPRLLRRVFDEALYADEEIVAEYLSGVLASSGDGNKNDRGVAITALIRRLSALQLRVHYVLYSELLRHKIGHPVDLRWSIERNRLHVEFDMEEFVRTLGFEELSPDARRDLIGHAIWGLSREQLIDEDSWEFIVERNEQTPLGAHADTDRDPLVSFHPTALGAELFLWGCGSAVIDSRAFLDPALELVISDEFPALASTRILDMTGISSGSIELEQAREEKSWGVILQAGQVDAAPGVHLFYRAIATLFVGDYPTSCDLMTLSGLEIECDNRKQGLDILDRMRAHNPHFREQLWHLSKLLSVVQLPRDDVNSRRF